MMFCSKSDCSFYFACWLVVFGRRQRAVITCTEEYSNCTLCVCVCKYIYLYKVEELFEERTRQATELMFIAYIHVTVN